MIKLDSFMTKMHIYSVMFNLNQIKSSPLNLNVIINDKHMFKYSSTSPLAYKGKQYVQEYVSKCQILSFMQKFGLMLFFLCDSFLNWISTQKQLFHLFKGSWTKHCFHTMEATARDMR